MSIHEQILEFIDNMTFPALIAELNQVKNKFCFDLIQQVVEESGKEVSEAVLVFLSAIRFLAREKEKPASVPLQEFIEAHAQEIVRISNDRKVQANLPQRALPVLEVLAKQIGEAPVSVIELGCSYGLIGLCLLNADRVVARREHFFREVQQMPADPPRPVARYLGIDLAPPDKEWLLACEEDRSRREHLERFIEEIAPDDRFIKIQGNAFGFSSNEIVKEFIADAEKVVVMTSFMLYQYPRELQKQLTDEIKHFTKQLKGHWISQVVDVEALTFHIQWNNKTIVELTDDSCIRWKWLD